MEFSSQVRTFFLIMATGIFLGILFDTYRVLNRRFRPPWFVTALTDLAYCLLAAGVAFTALLAGNWGELRFYVFIALLTGLVMYYKLASRRVVQLVTALLLFLVTMWQTAKRVFAITIIKPVLYATRIVLWPLRFTRRRCAAWYRKWRPPPSPPPEEGPPL
ncbi:spore cortex biosynthesis protein YabQ [Sporomusa aerivorans]|uniref:spore cortex biosynthesis protein YabQ n=1 Tax=Sporomusa aerivorans TaxID=204936 RepID=UPI00352B24E6